jgi:transglutaminase-like putative cysteine protease
VALVGTVLFLLTPRPPGLFISTFPFAGRVPLGDPLRGEIVNPAYPEGTRYGQVFNPGGYFGFSPTVDLRLRGRLNDAVVMRVRTLERRLLRGLVFDTYTGTGWEIGDHTVTEHKARIPPVELLRGHDEVYGYRLRDRRLVQTFYIERHQPNVLFAVPRAERVYLPHGWAYVDRYSAVRLPFVLEPGMIYTVVSRPLDAPVETLRAARGDYPSFITERYLQLPPGLPGRVRALAQEVSAGAATQYERVVAINRYLWTRYRYDLTIGPQRRPGDAVDYFLFEEPRGYCEQFASAMVVLLRSIGVPARLVTGYTPGTYQPLTGLLEVRNLDAHAWVEVLFPGLGWVEFEPTPGFVDPAVAEARFMPRWGWEGVGHFLRDRLGTSLAGISLAGILGSGRLPLEKHGFVWLALMAAVLGGLALGRQAVRRRDRSPVHEIWSAYGLLIRLLARRGLLRRPAETPGEFGRRAQAVVDWPEVSALTALLERAAYGPEGAAPAMVGEARLHAQVLRQREGHRHGFMPSLRRR